MRSHRAHFSTSLFFLFTNFSGSIEASQIHLNLTLSCRHYHQHHHTPPVPHFYWHYFFFVLMNLKSTYKLWKIPLKSYHKLCSWLESRAAFIFKTMRSIFHRKSQICLCIFYYFGFGFCRSLLVWWSTPLHTLVQTIDLPSSNWLGQIDLPLWELKAVTECAPKMVKYWPFVIRIYFWANSIEFGSTPTL